MDDYRSLSHTKWSANTTHFHPRSAVGRADGHLRKHLGEVFRRLAARKRAKTGRALMADHVHAHLDSIRSAGLRWWGTSKGRRIHLARVYGEREPFCGAALLGTRIFCPTVGRDETVVRVSEIGEEDKRWIKWTRT